MVTVPAGGVIEGDEFARYAGLNGPLRELVQSKSEDKPPEADPNDQGEGQAIGDSIPGYPNAENAPTSRDASDPEGEKKGRRKGLAANTVLPPTG